MMISQPTIQRTHRLVKPRPLKSLSLSGTLDNAIGMTSPDVKSPLSPSSGNTPQSPIFENTSELETARRHIILLKTTIENQPSATNAVGDLVTLLQRHGCHIDTISPDTVSAAIVVLKRAIHHPSPQSILPKSLQAEILELIELRERKWVSLSPSLDKFVERYSVQMMHDIEYPNVDTSSSYSDTQSEAGSIQSGVSGQGESLVDVIVQYADIRAAKIGKVFTIDGERVKKIEEITNTRLELVPQLTEGNGTLRQIKITGTSETSIKKACLLIQRIASAANNLHIKSILGKAGEGDISSPTVPISRLVANFSHSTSQSTPVNKTPVDGKPVEVSPDKDTPAKDTTVKDTPAKNTHVNEALVNDISINDIALKEAITKESSSQTDVTENGVDNSSKMTVTTKRGEITLSGDNRDLIKEAMDLLQYHFNKAVGGPMVYERSMSLQHDYGGGGDHNRRPMFRSHTNHEAFIRVIHKDGRKKTSNENKTNFEINNREN